MRSLLRHSFLTSYLSHSLSSKWKKTAGGDKKDSILFLFAFFSLFCEFTHNQNMQRELVMVSKVSDRFDSEDISF